MAFGRPTPDASSGGTRWSPLLLPTVILPALMPIALARVVYLDERGKPIAAPDVKAERLPAAAEAASPAETPAAPIPQPPDGPPTLARPPT